VLPPGTHAPRQKERSKTEARAPALAPQVSFDRLPSCIWDRLETIRLTGFVVFAALASHLPRGQSLEGGTCFPSIKRLAKKTTLATRTVQSALARLEKAGLIDRDQSGGAFGTTLYRLGPAALHGESPDASRTPPAPRCMGDAATCTPPLHADAPPPVHPRAPRSKRQGERRSTEREKTEEQCVFEAWTSTLAAQDGCRLTGDRRRVIRARLAEGYTVEDLMAAVRGWINDPWPERPRHNDLTTLLRDGGQVEKFRELQRNPPPKNGQRSAVAELRAQGSDGERRAQLSAIDRSRTFDVGPVPEAEP
jgi:DNA-binding transcriptional ArsR family regulator